MSIGIMEYIFTTTGLSMIERSSATEDEMISAFLRAEIDSSRYGGELRQRLARLGVGQFIIDSPDLADVVQNALRKCLMSYRGYDSRQDLFTGFPFDVAWREVDLEIEDLKAMRYINDTVTATPNWTELSGGTRLVSDGARNLYRFVSDERFRHILSIAQRIDESKPFPPLIAAQHHEGHLVLIEGHSRATAYVRKNFTGGVNAFVGSSPSMNRWAFY